MDGSALLSALDGVGARLMIVDGGLRVEVASRALTPAMREALADKGPLLSAYLAREWQRHVDGLPLRVDDPRSDIAVDSQWWTQLLNLAHGAGPVELREALHCLRCLGARLIWDGPALRLVAGSEIDAAEYADYRARWLVPHAAALGEVLRTLATLAHQIEARRRVAA
jgi:hypothetical protein